MDDSVRMSSQRASVESEQLALLEKANLNYFLKSIGIPALCWAVLFLYVLPVVAGKADGEKWLVALIYPASLLGIAWFSAIFCYEWLAIITLKTPVNYRAKLNLLGAIAIGALLGAGHYDNPINGILRMLRYLEHHGFFVLKMLAVGLVVFTIAFLFAREASLKDFPRYPLRWYGGLAVSAALISNDMVPDEMISEYHFYAGDAYYLGVVITGFVAFYFGAKFGGKFCRRYSDAAK